MLTKVKNILKVNWVKTIIFNFKMLPCKQAIYLPIILYGKVDISGCVGRVILNSERVHHKMAFIGCTVFHFGKYGVCSNLTMLTICGTLHLGEKSRIQNGCTIYVAKEAHLELEDFATIGPNNEVYCTKHIYLGPYFLSSWNCQLFDTSCHFYAENQVRVHRLEKEVYIGNNCWIGNNTTIARGTRLGDFCIVASKSLVNKDFSNIVGGLFAGSPAKLYKENVCRIVSLEKERWLHQYFKTHDDDVYSLPSWDDSLIRF